MGKEKKGGIRRGYFQSFGHEWQPASSGCSALHKKNPNQKFLRNNEKIKELYLKYTDQNETGTNNEIHLCANQIIKKPRVYLYNILCHMTHGQICIYNIF